MGFKCIKLITNTEVLFSKGIVTTLDVFVNNDRLNFTLSSFTWCTARHANRSSRDNIVFGQMCKQSICLEIPVMSYLAGLPLSRAPGLSVAKLSCNSSGRVRSGRHREGLTEQRCYVWLSDVHNEVLPLKVCSAKSIITNRAIYAQHTCSFSRELTARRSLCDETMASSAGAFSLLPLIWCLQYSILDLAAVCVGNHYDMR